MTFTLTIHKVTQWKGFCPRRPLDKLSRASPVMSQLTPAAHVVPRLSIPLKPAWAYGEPDGAEQGGGLILQLPCCCCEYWLQHCDLISDLWMLLLLRLRQYLYSPPALPLPSFTNGDDGEGGWLSSVGL